MESDDIVYRRLQKHLDRMPVGFPESKTGAEIKILKELFTPEEAEITLELSMLPEPAERIYPRVKKFIRNVEELESKLDDMYNRGLILGGRRLSKDNKKKYSNDQFIVGIYESHVTRITKGLMSNVVNYALNDFYKEFTKEGVPVQMRTIPIHKSIIRENCTETYDDIRYLVKNTEGTITIITCVCREGKDKIGLNCRLSDLRETCMTFGAVSDSCIERGMGRVILKDEALSLLDKFEDKGFVVQPENNRKPEFVCFCCGCCCGVLNMIKRLPKPAEHYESNYFARVNNEACTGCGACIPRCQMGALSLESGKVVINPDRCIGCGLCTSRCVTGAILLERKPEPVVPPADHDDLYNKILSTKIGPAGVFKAKLKHRLGIKV